MPYRLLVSALLGIHLVLQSFPTHAKEQEKICLVLSGGGARGAAHVGVLQVLEEMRIPISCIVGTSMGAIVGAAYASGREVGEMQAILGELSNESLLRDDPPRVEQPMRRKMENEREYIGPELGLDWRRGVLLPTGAVSGTALEAVLRKLTQTGDFTEFDALPIPFRTLATDLASGEMKVFARGNLARVIRASMSVPGAFAPLEIDGALLVDGGLVRNLGVDIARQMGADRIIAVNLGTPLLARAEIQDALSVTTQMINILTEQNVRTSLAQLGKDDILISPELGNASAADFSAMGKLVPIGAAAARAQAVRLAALRVNEESYANWRSRLKYDALTMHTAQKKDKPIAAIRISGTHKTNPQTILASLHSKSGQALNQAILDADLRRLYGWGDFERISYRVSDQENGDRVLELEIKEKSWGPDYLRFGLGLEGRLGGGASFDLLAALRRSWRDQLGAEARAEVQIGQHGHLLLEWHQPLDITRRFFVEAQGGLQLQPLNVFQGEQQIANFNNRSALLTFDAGVNLSNNLQWRVGVERGQQKFMKTSGDTSLPQALQSHLGAWHVKLRYDNSDSGTFARSGDRLHLELRNSLRGLGADTHYRRWQADWRRAYASGPHVWQIFAAAGGHLGAGELPIYEYFSLGGAFRLPAYATGRFSGPSYRYASLLYAHQLFASRFVRAGYAGLKFDVARMEANNLTGNDGRGVGSFGPFVSFDSMLGPIYLGVSLAPGGQTGLSLWLGAPR